MRGDDPQSGKDRAIPTLKEVVRPGPKRQTPPNLDLFENPPEVDAPAESASASEEERVRDAFIEELDRRVENLVRSRVQRLADNLAEDVMKTLKREIRNIAKGQKDR